MRHDDSGSYYVVYGAKEPGTKHPKRIDIEQYPIANSLINSMMPVVMKHVGMSTVMKYKLFQVNFHTTLSGQAVVTMIYHKKLREKEAEWKAKAALLRHAPTRACRLAVVESCSAVHQCLSARVISAGLTCRIARERSRRTSKAEAKAPTLSWTRATLWKHRRSAAEHIHRSSL